MHKLIIPMVNTVLWSWFIAWSMDTAILSVLLFPWLIVVLYWPVAIASAVVYFWACCYAGVCRLDRRSKRWLEVCLLIPWVVALLPLVIHVGAFVMLVRSWGDALRQDHDEQPDEQCTALVIYEG